MKKLISRLIAGLLALTFAIIAIVSRKPKPIKKYDESELDTKAKELEANQKIIEERKRNLDLEVPKAKEHDSIDSAVRDWNERK